METRITKRDVLMGLVAMGNGGTTEISWEDIVKYAENEIELLDKKASKAAERAAAKRVEGDELQEVIYEALSEDFEPIADILARIDGEDVTAAKAAVRLRRLVDAGKAEKSEIKVKPEGGKTRTLVAYRRVDM